MSSLPDPTQHSVQGSYASWKVMDFFLKILEQSWKNILECDAFYSGSYGKYRDRM